jgi:hypothetical protein
MWISQTAKIARPTVCSRITNAKLQRALFFAITHNTPSERKLGQG